MPSISTATPDPRRTPDGSGPPKARGYGHGAPSAPEAGHVTVKVSEIIIWESVSYVRPLMLYRIPVN